MDGLLLSVILAIRNEAQFVEQALTDLVNQDIDYQDVEILVADGCSDDGTLETVIEVCAKYQERRIRVFSNPLMLQYAGVNRMVQLSRGRYLLIVDGHSRFPANFLSANLRSIRQGGAQVVGGRWETAAGAGTSIARAIAACLSTRFGVGNARYRISGSGGEVDAAAFPCVDRTAFARVGLFREELLSNADTEFYARVRANGYCMKFDREIRSVYFARHDLRAIARQMFRNGKWFTFQFEATRPRHVAPLVLVLANVALLFGGVFLPALWIVWMGLGSAYLSLALGSALSCVPLGVRVRAGDRLLMPVCYVVMHLAYGAGWIHGLVAEDTRRARRSRRDPAPRIGGLLSPPLEEVEPVDPGTNRRAIAPTLRRSERMAVSG